MVNVRRVFKHLFMPSGAWRRAFPRATLDAIEAAVASSETGHRGEIRFAIENSLPAGQVWRGISGRERAIEAFARLRVWDTEHNSGVLIYLLLADHDIEIVADRGIAAQVAPADWEAVAHAMETAFRQGDFERGALDGIARINAILTAYLPSSGHNPDELANRPVILGR